MNAFLILSIASVALSQSVIIAMYALIERFITPMKASHFFPEDLARLLVSLMVMYIMLRPLIFLKQKTEGL